MGRATEDHPGLAVVEKEGLVRVPPFPQLQGVLKQIEELGQHLQPQQRVGGRHGQVVAGALVEDLPV